MRGRVRVPARAATLPGVPYPLHDSYPDRPVEDEPIPLGLGQEPNAMGHDGSFTYDSDASAGTTSDRAVVKRNGEPITIISRWPERW